MVVDRERGRLNSLFVFGSVVCFYIIVVKIFGYFSNYCEAENSSTFPSCQQLRKKVHFYFQKLSSVPVTQVRENHCKF